MLTLKWFFGNRDDLTDVHNLHRSVFINEQNVPENAVFDGSDAECIHLVAYDDEIPVSTGRVNVCDEFFTIARICTLPSQRGKGLASGIVDTLIESCIQMGGSICRVSSQVSAQEFYEKLGFVAIGEEYDIAGIPHVAMEHSGKNRGCSGNCSTCRGETS